MKININKEALKVIILGLILVIMGGWAFNNYAYKPLQEKSAKLDEQIKEKDRELKETEAIVANLEIKKAECKRLKEELNYVVARLPNKKEMPELVKTITKIGVLSQIEFSSFSPEPIISEEFYDRVPIKLSATGRYHNLGIFLSKIGGLERILIPSKLSIRAMRTEKSSDTVQVDMIITAFIYKGAVQ